MAGVTEKYNRDDARVIQVLKSENGNVIGHRFKHLDGRVVVDELQRLGSKTDLAIAPEF